MTVRVGESLGPMLSAVRACIAEADLPPRAAALCELAAAYAVHIDAADDPAKALSDLGPKLQSALSGLGLAVVLPGGRSEAPRAAVAAPGGGVSPADALAALRAERERRAG